MSSTVNLVYPKPGVEFDGHWLDRELYDFAMVQPFEAGGGTNLARLSAEELLEEFAAYTVGSAESASLYEATMDIPNGYGRITRDKTGFHFDELAGLTGHQAYPELLTLHARLDGEPDADPWLGTEGNVKEATSAVLAWTVQHPDASFLVYG